MKLMVRRQTAIPDGVWNLINILEAIERGVDMFDCVMPTRNGRNGMIFTSRGIMNMKNEKWKNDFHPSTNLAVRTLIGFNHKAQVRHLFGVKEFAAMADSIHSTISHSTCGLLAKHALTSNWEIFTWKKEMVSQLGKRLVKVAKQTDKEIKNELSKDRSGRLTPISLRSRNVFSIPSYSF